MCEPIAKHWHVLRSPDLKLFLALQLVCFFLESKLPDDVREVFNEIRDRDESVLNALSVAAELAALEQCRVIPAHGVVTWLDRDVYAGTALVDGYGNSGMVSEARRVFEELLLGMNVLG
ncbi:hypothetical protein Ancab_013046 [Ancistrocladus abbreviatus]